MISRLLTVFCALCLCTATHAMAVIDTADTQLHFSGEITSMLANSAATDKIDFSRVSSGNDSSIISEANLSVYGYRELNDYLAAIGYLKVDYAREAHYAFTRYGYVGIDAKQYGILTAGRGNGAFYTVAGISDIFEQLDFSTNEYYATGDQMPSLLMYSISAMGWDFRASLITGGRGLNEVFDVRKGYELAVATMLSNKISFAYGYGYYDLTYNDDELLDGFYNGYQGMFAHLGSMLANMYPDAPASYILNKKPGHRADFGVALSYGQLGDGLYMGLVFSRSKYQHFTHPLYNYEGVINYQFENGFGMSMGYAQQRFGSKRLISDLNLGLYFKFNSQFKIFAEAQIDLGSSPASLYNDQWILRDRLGENKYLIGATFSF